MMTLKEALEWYTTYKPERRPLFDFMRPLPPTCKDCGYPLGGKNYRLKFTECHWKPIRRKNHDHV